MKYAVQLMQQSMISFLVVTNCLWLIKMVYCIAYRSYWFPILSVILSRDFTNKFYLVTQLTGNYGDWFLELENPFYAVSGWKAKTVNVFHRRRMYLVSAVLVALYRVASQWLLVFARPALSLGNPISINSDN